MRCPSTATPRLYQEIRERGLNSTNQDELLDDFVVVEAPVEDQGIVVQSYRPAQLTWSQLPQVKPRLFYLVAFYPSEIVKVEFVAFFSNGCCLCCLKSATEMPTFIYFTFSFINVCQRFNCTGSVIHAKLSCSVLS